ncbi:MAG: hypothetical protein QM817_23600 [Archangium sp.]
MRQSLCLLVLLAGCQGAVGELPGDQMMETEDASVEFDAGDVTDAGLSEVDAGGEEQDAGFDAGVEVDAGFDAGFDAGLPDAGFDAGFDAGVVDAGIPDAGPTSARQTQRQLGTTDAGNGYYEYLPPNYGDGVPRPLLIFWHGIGENGNGTSELGRVLANGPPKLINQNRWSNGWPFVVISPQHAGGGCPSSGEIHAMISYAITHYTLDTKRLYLTGLSCGAIGSWSYVGQYLDQQIAAAVLIAGDPGPVNMNYSVWGRNMCNLGKVPIWSFHGSADGTVLPGNDRDTMNLLIPCPAPPRLDAIYTEYPGVGHDSWSRTYDLSAGHDIYTWLLQQSKP